MPTDKFFKTLGLARRAGKLCSGYDSVTADPSSLAAVYLASDLSEKSAKGIVFALKDSGVTPKRLDCDMSQIGFAIGKKPVGIIGVTDAGFADLLNKEVTE